MSLKMFALPFMVLIQGGHNWSYPMGQTRWSNCLALPHAHNGLRTLFSQDIKYSAM